LEGCQEAEGKEEEEEEMSSRPKGKKNRMRLQVGQQTAQKYLSVTAHCCNATKWASLVKRCVDIGLHSESERHSLDAIRLLSSMLLPQDPIKFLQVIQAGDGAPSTLEELRAKHRELQAMRSTAASIVMDPLQSIKDTTITSISEETKHGEEEKRDSSPT